jgi:WavE lipopolysaccharide synthesis
MKLITDFDLSIVVQGAIENRVVDTRKNFIPDGYRTTEYALFKLRQVFPKAEIILSTWEGSDVSQLEFDKVVFNKDPGAYIFNDHQQLYMNLNRQVVSTVGGLKLVSRKYAMKVRTDMLFDSISCLDYLNQYLNKVRTDQYQLLKDRVLVTTITSFNPRKEVPYPHFPCDWLFLGLTEDICDIFHIPLTNEPSFSRWYENHPKPKNHYDPYSLAQYQPESYIWSTFVKKKVDLCFEYSSDISNNNIEISEAIFANNLVICSPSQLGFISLKYDWKIDVFPTRYTHLEWLKLYRKICDQNLKDNRIDFERISINLASKVILFKKFLPEVGESIKVNNFIIISILHLISLLPRVAKKFVKSLLKLSAKQSMPQKA